MELNELLAKHIMVAGLKKEAVASGWAEAWRNTSGKSYTDDTVRTTLSRALKGEVPAVRFFFGQPKRAQLLARQLQLTDDQDNELRQAAERHLERDGKRPTRTVLEMAPFGDLSPAIWQTLIERLLEAKDAGPFELVVTELQDRKLPRLWDGYPDLIRLRRVADASQWHAAVLEAAGDEAVILSRKRYPSYERWGAMDAGYRGIAFEPEDALARIGADGALDEPPVPAHPLAEQPPPLLDAGVAAQMQRLAAAEVRRLAFALSTETITNDRPPDWRARMAAALGIRAAQTTEERLGQKLVKVDPQELERLLQRAERVATPAMALLVDNKQVVLVNPDPAMAAVVEGTSAKIHHIEAKPTALHYLRAHDAGLVGGDCKQIAAAASRELATKQQRSRAVPRRAGPSRKHSGCAGACTEQPTRVP